jgi:disulfide bond formation protein DsbB
VRHFIPCTLCWYQRILMYPLVLILGVASYRQDRSVVVYALPLSLLGVGVSLFHYLDQKIPGFGPPGLCSGGVPCSAAYIDWLGFITIPFLALVAFAGISAALLTMRARQTPTAPR